jgi:hypothetical protein
MSNLWGLLMVLVVVIEVIVGLFIMRSGQRLNAPRGGGGHEHRSVLLALERRA